MKPWGGYGASVAGFDGHNYSGRLARFPGGNFAAHVTPFLGAIASRVVGVMPTYAILDGLSIDGTPLEPVGAGFNRQLLGDQLGLVGQLAVRGQHALVAIGVGSRAVQAHDLLGVDPG